MIGGVRESGADRGLPAPDAEAVSNARPARPGSIDTSPVRAVAEALVVIARSSETAAGVEIEIGITAGRVTKRDPADAAGREVGLVEETEIGRGPDRAVAVRMRGETDGTAAVPGIGIVIGDANDPEAGTRTVIVIVIVSVSASVSVSVSGAALEAVGGIPLVGGNLRGASTCVRFVQHQTGGSGNRGGNWL